MRKSTHVAAPLLTAAALAMMSGGCRKPEMQRCVDESNIVVDDSLCANQPPTNQQNQNLSGSGYAPYHPMYHYYYGGWGGYGWGTQAGGGSTVPSEGHSYTNSSGRSTTIRGGFGSSMSGDGGHGSGAGE